MTRQWIVTGTSMVVEADTEEEAIARAEQSSGWHWEAEEQVRGCSCGMADYGAPGHDGDPENCSVCGQPDNCGDCDHTPVDAEHAYAEYDTREALCAHLVAQHGMVQMMADHVYNAGDHHLRTLHRMLHREDPEGD